MKNLALSGSLDSSRETDELFRQHCLQYSEILKSEGVNARPFRSPELPSFSRLPHPEKLRSIEQIRSALEIFEETRNEGQSLHDSPKLLWRSMRKIGWVPRPDIFGSIEDEDVVIVYSLDQRQIFQNLRFFDFVSMTLEDIYTQTWQQYSRRDPQVEKELYGIAIELLSGRKPETFDPGLPQHLCEEVGTEELLRFQIRIRLMSPLLSEGAVCGALVVNRCSFLSPVGAQA